MIDRIYYSKGYKNWLRKPYSVQTPIVPCRDIVSSGGFIMLDYNGVLHLKAGYAWDGASGAINTNTFMRPSLIHDGFYQLFREGKLSLNYRKQVDELLGSMCRADGMNKIRAWYVVLMVKLFAGTAASPQNRKPILYAP